MDCLLDVAAAFFYIIHSRSRFLSFFLPLYNYFSLSLFVSFFFCLAPFLPFNFFTLKMRDCLHVVYFCHALNHWIKFAFVARVLLFSIPYEKSYMHWLLSTCISVVVIVIALVFLFFSFLFRYCVCLCIFVSFLLLASSFAFCSLYFLLFTPTNFIRCSFSLYSAAR